jgi:hypothetical protein
VSYQPSSWLDQLVGACFSLLVGAAAVFIAVRLILAVWTALLVILGVAGFGLVAVMVLQGRRRGW